jgi:DNA-binding response OmpR family regulator
MSNPASPIALLLEDDVLIAMDVECTLADGGFEVVTCTTCSQARTWLNQNHPSVAVVDLHLRDGPSTEAVRLLTSLGIPFIIHSGVPGWDASLDEAFKSGRWISKPSTSDELIAAARALAEAPSRVDA